MKAFHRVVLFAFLLCGITLLIGCIPWTTKQAYVNDAEVSRPQARALRKHSRYEVAQRLGPPASEDDRHMVYQWRMHRERGWITLCGFISDESSILHRSLILQFDDHGYLVDWSFEDSA